MEVIQMKDKVFQIRQIQMDHLPGVLSSRKPKIQQL
jgi:hypothetical protein